MVDTLDEDARKDLERIEEEAAAEAAAAVEDYDAMDEEEAAVAAAETVQGTAFRTLEQNDCNQKNSY